MNETDRTLQRFVADYRSRAIPPPHTLLVGPDAGRSEMVANSFAERLGIEFHSIDASKIAAQGDITAHLWGKRVSFISNLHLLKKPLVQKLSQDLQDGAITVVIGAGPAARIHKIGPQ